MTRRPFRVDSERKIVAAAVSAAVKRCSPHGSATKGRAGSRRVDGQARQVRGSERINRTSPELSPESFRG